MSEIQNNTYVIFRINQELFALSTDMVTEVIEINKITEVPNAPEHILGVTNFRGNILPVLSSKIKFGFGKDDLSGNSFVVLVLDIEIEKRNSQLGLVVDEVSDVLKVSINEIDNVPTGDSKFDPEYLEGAFKRDDKYLYILNAQKVFAIKDLQLMI
ncbi:MAG: purine-binding chemotaxis protein CheW [Bacteroidales bacterium]|nr:purine-binding chemotaxis protein CheW [Bacteroidales bacterium]